MYRFNFEADLYLVVCEFAIFLFFQARQRGEGGQAECCLNAGVLSLGSLRKEFVEGVLEKGGTTSRRQMNKLQQANHTWLVQPGSDKLDTSSQVEVKTIVPVFVFLISQQAC